MLFEPFQAEEFSADRLFQIRKDNVRRLLFFTLEFRDSERRSYCETSWPILTKKMGTLPLGDWPSPHPEDGSGVLQ